VARLPGRDGQHAVNLLDPPSLLARADQVIEQWTAAASC